jgi:peroxiredoxin
MLSSGFFNFFPNDFVEGPRQLIFGNGTFFMSLKIQIPQKVDLDFSDVHFDSLNKDSSVRESVRGFEITCFLIPFDTLDIIIDYAKGNQQQQITTFNGKYALISEYYLDKKRYFNNLDLIQQKARLSNSATNLDEFKNSIDSITKAELNFLNRYKSKKMLPLWFVDYETSDLTYFAYASKLGEPMVIGLMNGSTMRTPEDYYSFTRDLPLQNEHAILSIYYYLGLRDYFNLIWEPAKMNEIKSSKEDPNGLADFVHYSTSQFSRNISDVLLARELDMLIQVNRISDGDYTLLINAIKDLYLKKYLEVRYKNKVALKPGDQAPYFYLMNEQNTWQSLKQFKDSIVYIGFWFIGCKPCIKEFPGENHLIDVFRTEPVKIISICIDSKEEDWRSLITRHQLKSVNLYANRNWGKSLKESYDISGFPHYVLIGRDGNIVENKCARPSMGAEQAIRKCLNSK